MSGWGSIYNNVSYALRTHSAELARLQEQAATGSRVVRASDDPSDAHRILQLRGQAQSLGTYQENLHGVLGNLEYAHTIVNTVFDNNDDDDINTDGVTIIERGK